MQIRCFKKHHVTECERCGSIMWREHHENIVAAYRDHLAMFPDCQKWHDAAVYAAANMREWRPL
jgi:hypothetical protein